MPQSTVRLLAVVGAAMSALAGFAHGDLVWLIITDAAATRVAAYLAAPANKEGCMRSMDICGSHRSGLAGA